jgi:uncharacterized protein (TIGR00730 family)
MKNKLNVCVFCGSSEGTSPAYSKAAYELGVLIAKEGLNLVYGGGNNGLMGTVANAALSFGGHVTGIIPQFLQESEVGHPNLTELIVVEDMHKRKRLMYDRAGMFVSLPGGTGTFDETIEVMTWAQLNVFKKKIVLIDVDSYWEPFLNLIKHGIKQGFIQPKNESLLCVVKSPNDVIKIAHQVQQDMNNE